MSNSFFLWDIEERRNLFDVPLKYGSSRKKPLNEATMYTPMEEGRGKVISD